MKKKGFLLLVLTGSLLFSCDNLSKSSSSSPSFSSSDDSSSQSTSNESSSSSESNYTYLQYSTEDIALISSLIGRDDIPFVPSYDYEVYQDTTSSYGVGFYYETDEEMLTYLIDGLKTNYNYDGSEVDSDNDTWYLFSLGEDLYIDLVGYTYSGAYYIEMFAYLPEDYSWDDGELDTSYYEISYDTVGSEFADLVEKSSSATYIGQETNINVDGITYAFGAKSGLASSDYNSGYASLNAFQVQKNKEFFHNVTPFEEGVDSILIQYFSTYSLSDTSLPVVYGGDSLSDLSVSGITCEVLDGYQMALDVYEGKYQVTAYYIEYDFASPVSYIEVDAGGYNAFIGGVYIFSGDSDNSSSDDNIVDTGSSTLPEDDGNGYQTVDFTKGKVKNVTELGYYVDGCPTTGNPDVLVIPVEFDDATAASKGYSIDTLKKAFSGTSDDVEYETVHDFFYKSSNETLDLDITIVDEWFKPSQNFSYYEKMNNSMNTLPTDIYGNNGRNSSCTPEQLILNEALAYLDNQGYDLSKYDSDNNGVIDSVVLVYTADIDSTSDNSFAWAWRYWNLLADTSNNNDYYYYDDVVANDYVWLSYQFLFETTDDEGYTSFNKTGTLNTYTFCHEFSHVLGSDDYYDADTGYSTCLGGYDLMDNAFADHTAFNKILYGWITSSKLITTSSSVTLSLNDFETSGETLIVANSWDESLGMFQEYWIIEYYSNNGLNASLPGLFDEEGIIIHHINATLSYDSSYGMYDLAYSNASKSSKHNLISYVMNGNSYLFQAGDKVSTSTKDDKNKSIPYQISIDSLENGVATITFTKA